MAWTWFFCCFIFISMQTGIHSEWIDPYSMNDDAVIDRNALLGHSALNCDADAAVLSAYYKRALIKILNSLTYDRTSESYRGQFRADLRQEQYEFLKSFVDSEMSKDGFGTVDEILVDVFGKSQFEEYCASFLNWRAVFYSFCLSRECCILLGLLVVLRICYHYIHYGFSFRTITLFLVLTFYLMDYAFTWIRLLQDKEIEQMRAILHKPPPEECDPSRMPFLLYTRYLLIDLPDKCKQFHFNEHKNLFWEVSPVVVLATQLGLLLVTPATHCGNALGLFSKAILSNFSWWSGPFIFPFILVFSLLITGIILSFITGTSFRINFFHLIQYSFGEARHTDAISSRKLEQILGVLERPAIQEVKDCLPERKETNVKKSERKETNVKKKSRLPIVEDLGSDMESDRTISESELMPDESFEEECDKS